MIFASDLDQTLIYSRRSFRLELGQKEPPLCLVETLEGREVSYMTVDSVNKLRKLAGQLWFVPVTTRTVAQYERLRLFQEPLYPAYAIVSNGGNILVNGQLDEAWQKHIFLEINQECAPIDVILERFKATQPKNWVLSEHLADNLFYYYLIDRNRLPINEVRDFAAWAYQQKWQVSLQGRKLYIVPHVVNKWRAVNEVRNRLQENRIVAAGDSLLDLCILEECHTAIAPCHGEIWEAHLRGELAVSIPQIQFTKREGLQAAEDILSLVAEQIGDQRLIQLGVLP